jgi:hypothetical protein
LVHAHLVRLPAELTPSREEPVNQLLVTDVGPGWFAIPQDRVLLPSERNTSECGDPWLLAIAARDAELNAFARPVRRFLAGRCELCGQADKVRVHQIRKLADLNNPGQPQPDWMQIMAKRRRKTLIVCATCHATIHLGRPTASTTG